MPKKYRKKPVVIEAVEFTLDSVKTELPNFLNSGAPWKNGETPVFGSNEFDMEVWCHIPTKEGIMKASLGDFIIKGVQGEFYPCKPDIFKQTYEEV